MKKLLIKSKQKQRLLIFIVRLIICYKCAFTLKLSVVKSQLEKTNSELHAALKEKIDVEK